METCEGNWNERVLLRMAKPTRFVVVVVDIFEFCGNELDWSWNNGLARHTSGHVTMFSEMRKEHLLCWWLALSQGKGFETG